MAFVQKNCSIRMEIFIFLLIFLIILGYPYLIIIFSGCWINKHFALNLAKRDPKFGKILEGIDAVLAGPDPYIDPHIIVTLYFLLTDELDVPTVVKFLKEKVIEPNLYPELTQRIVKKYGYHFYYNVDIFEVESHVRYLNPDSPKKPITRNELKDILINKLGNLPFDSRKSPWEILVIPKFIDDNDAEMKSAFVLRVNHCLMDGYSVTNFLQKLAFKPWKFPFGQNPKEKQGIIVKLYTFLSLFLFGPYYFLKMFVFTNDCHKFVENAYKPDLQELCSSPHTPSVTKARLKFIQNAYGVTMSSLTATLFGQATWKSLRRAGIPVSSTIHGLFSFPISGHGDVLTNHCALVKLPVKVDETDPRNTLKFMEKEFQRLRNSVEPLVFLYFNKLVALIPLWLRTNSKSIVPTTFALTNFPGPTEPFDIFGCMVKEMGLGGKPSRGIAYIHGSFGFAENFWFQGGGPVCNLPTHQDTEVLVNFILDTLYELEAKIPLHIKQK